MVQKNHSHLKMTFAGMNIFVAFFVLLLLLSESTPKAAESIPLIGKESMWSMLVFILNVDTFLV